MTESPEHRLCKDNLADLLGGKTEVPSSDGSRRFDVVDQKGDPWEVECKRGSEGEMNCVIATPKKQTIDCDCINNLTDSF